MAPIEIENNAVKTMGYGWSLEVFDNCKIGVYSLQNME